MLLISKGMPYVLLVGALCEFLEEQQEFQQKNNKKNINKEANKNVKIKKLYKHAKINK